MREREESTKQNHKEKAWSWLTYSVLFASPTGNYGCTNAFREVDPFIGQSPSIFIYLFKGP